jgi:alkaline phosphatase D
MADFTRRSAFGLAAGVALAAAVPDRSVAAAAPDAPHPALGNVLTRIAFGSCADQSKDQPIWDAVLSTRPDLFVFLGDNIYADTRDMAVVRQKYAMLASKPGFQRLRATTPVVAIWDDHDFGEDDAGSDYPMKAETRAIFCDFWGEAAQSVRRTRDGIYASYIFGPAGRRVQILMPDLRWNRTRIERLDLAGTDYKTWAMAKADANLPVPGPYARNPDLQATMLGETQWSWLEAQLRQPAELRILASSLQVLADFVGWEGWINFAHDHQRLFDAIRDARAERLVCISGDTHYGEISRLDVNVPYPIWDFTSSGLTEVWPVMPPNALRQGDVWRERNFGLIEINWAEAAPVLTVQIRDEQGAPRLSQVVDTAQLRLQT